MYTTELTYKKILCPVDFSESSRNAFYKAVAYARVFEAQLVILHVREPGHARADFEDVEETTEEIARLEAGLVRRLNELQHDGQVSAEDRERISLEIRGGKPFLEVLRFATQNDVDLIVMGTHGRTGIKHMLIGSTAERVVRRAPCDVVTVKAPGYEPNVDLLVGS